MAACTNPEVQEKYLTLPRDEFIEYFNNQNFSWKITDYDRIFHFGIKEIPPTRRNEMEEKCNIEVKLPYNFDSRQRWPKCETIGQINDQGHCSSCWTFGTANTASDRTCIHKDIHVHLAEQDLQCIPLFENVCHGGYPEMALEFWQAEGLVSNKCKPYIISKLNGICKRECVDANISYQNDKHFAESIYKICDNQTAIQSEIYLNGPVEASFVVYKDIMDYRSGIYEHQYGEFKGYHSVRVIGYGVEDDKEYWLVANSWSAKWGEEGFFKIKANQAYIKFEKEIFTGLPKN